MVAIGTLAAPILADITLAGNVTFGSGYVAPSGSGNGLLNNLYSVWEMEQADNANVVDATGASHVAVRFGTIQRTTTHIEGTFAAESAQNAGWTNYSDTAFNTNGSFSCSAWIIGASDGDQIITYNGFGGAVNSFTLYFDGAGVFGTANRWLCVVRNAANTANYLATSTVNANTGTNLVVAVWDSGSNIGRISVNGETFVATATTDGLNSASDEGFQWGRVAARIDESCWWVNRVLSQGDVTLLWNSGNGLFYSGGGWQN